MDISLHPCQSTCVTTIPNVFIDRYMREANGEYVKIYLYLLRHLGTESLSFSIAKLAEDLEHTQRDVKLALKYWESEQLLKLEYDDTNELTGVFLMDPPINTIEKDTPNITLLTDNTIEAITKPSTVVVTTPAEIIDINPNLNASYVEEDDTRFKDLLYMTERLVGHPLNDTMINSIYYWHDELRLPIDLIEYLIEYCAEKQRTNLRYMNQVALNWANEGIFTVSDAKAANLSHSDITYAVMKAYGIKNRVLTSPELAYITRWTKTYGFSSEIIIEACHRTILSIQKASFDYTDSILKNWYEQKITNLSDIEHLDNIFSKNKQPAVKKPASVNRFHNFVQREYDCDSLQRQLSES